MPAPSAPWLRAIRRHLLDWYRQHRRDLPWRRRTDPYAIWVSEIMLQQTQVAAAIPYYERWLARFPDIASLAVAPPEAVLRAWEGLGYYSRARSLQAAARIIVDRHGGALPDSTPQLRALPGIGRYTAGAIASIAFGLPEPAVDGNVARVLCRLRALRGDPSRAPLQAELWDTAKALVARPGPGELNQALMELGALVCVTRAPRCASCPVGKNCRAFAENLVDQLPEPRSRPPATHREEVAALVERNAMWLVTRLPSDRHRWGGLWVFPFVEVVKGEKDTQAARRALRTSTGLSARPGTLIGTVRYSITRYRVELRGYACRLSTRQLASEHDGRFTWKQLADLEKLAMPVAHRKLWLELARRSEL